VVFWFNGNQVARTPDRNVSTDEIAKHLGRSVAAVRAAAQREGISLKPKNR